MFFYAMAQNHVVRVAVWGGPVPGEAPGILQAPVPLISTNIGANALGANIRLPVHNVAGM